jgi:hypothetical protein
LQIEWNPGLGGYRLQISVLSALCPQLNLLNPPPKKNSGYATAFSSVVRQMPGYNSQRRITARTSQFFFFVLLCMFRSLYSVYCLCINVYCTAATSCQPNCSKKININIKNISLVCVCGLSYTACEAHAPYYIAICGLNAASRRQALRPIHTYHAIPLPFPCHAVPLRV